MYLNKIFILISAMILSSCNNKLAPEDRLLYQVIYEHQEIQNKEHGLILVGLGGSIPKKIKGLIASYESFESLTVAQSRIIMVNSIESLLNIANNTPDLKPFMENYPFTIKNILSFWITFKKDPDQYVDYKYVSNVNLLNGKLYYDRYDSYEDKFAPLHEETFEEAIRIVREGLCVPGQHEYYLHKKE